VTHPLLITPIKKGSATSFDFLHQVCDGNGARQREEQMDVVGDRVGHKEIASAAPDDTAACNHANRHATHRLAREHALWC